MGATVEMGWAPEKIIIDTSIKFEVNTITHCLPALFSEQPEFPSIFIAQVCQSSCANLRQQPPCVGLK
jgi:hypothetical protein